MLLNTRIVTVVKYLARKTGSALLNVGEPLREWAVSESPLPPRQSQRKANGHLALIAGYFSYRDGFATFGDTEAMRVVMDWLTKAGIAFDIACHPSNGLSGLDIRDLDPNSYDIFVYVCGPWKQDNRSILDRFRHCLRIGVNLSVQDSATHGFDLLFCRDSESVNNPDIVFATRTPKKPLIGICLVHSQYEYGDRQRHGRVRDAVYRYLASNDVAFVEIDTLHRKNCTGIYDAASFEHVVSRLDAVISSRLHGLVFSLKNGVPVVAIDAIAGGAKLTNQAKSIGWPVVLNGDDVDEHRIAESVFVCMSVEMRKLSHEVGALAQSQVGHIEQEFIRQVTESLRTRR